MFAASTNAHDYLRDPTGDRRFWPLPLSSVDVWKAKGLREQIIAQAAVEVIRGEPWWPTSAVAVDAQRSRAADMPLASQILDAIETTEARTTIELLGLLGVEVTDTRGQNTLASQVSMVLRAAGWAQKSVRTDRGPRRMWVRVGK